MTSRCSVLGSRCLVLKNFQDHTMMSLSGPEILGPHNDIREIVWSWSGPETPVLGASLAAHLYNNVLCTLWHNNKTLEALHIVIHGKPGKGHTGPTKCWLLWNLIVTEKFRLFVATQHQQSCVQWFCCVKKKENNKRNRDRERNRNAKIRKKRMKDGKEESNTLPILGLYLWVLTICRKDQDFWLAMPISRCHQLLCQCTRSESATKHHSSNWSIFISNWSVWSGHSISLGVGFIFWWNQDMEIVFKFFESSTKNVCKSLNRNPSSFTHSVIDAQIEASLL